MWARIASLKVLRVMLGLCVQPRPPATAKRPRQGNCCDDSGSGLRILVSHERFPAVCRVSSIGPQQELPIQSIMKTHSVRAARGFTLIELLVVIAIIAVLAGVGFSAGSSAIQKAKKTTCLAAATSIESAVANFYTEYGSMPDSRVADHEIDTKSDNKFLNQLLGFVDTAVGANRGDLNPRGVKFLSVKEGKAKGSFGTNGLLYTGTGLSTSANGLYDPWGGSFKVILDLDYNERVSPSPSAGGGATLNGRRVAVWSDGADGRKADGSIGANKATDDVKTWGQ